MSRGGRGEGEHRRLLALSVVVALLAALVELVVAPAAAAASPCDAPITNPIACENTKAGNPQSEWGITGAGSSAIQGFADNISYAPGQTARFKVKTAATAYRLDIYRLGYYAGNGARKVATVSPSASLPQSQPTCLKQTSTGLYDCGNWAVSASWTIPSTAVSGIYFARLVRTDGTSGTSHVYFIVRDDVGQSPLLFQTSDTTWQAYNDYGGKSLYRPSVAKRAFKVSYNRPLNTRASAPLSNVLGTEYAMVRFLESNGYNVSYISGVDTARLGSELLEHRVVLSVGHDEYVSGQARANLEAARDAGVNLAFFSGNEVFWKTRWENSISSGSAAYRTLVSYKESYGDFSDPSAEWTGTWRDPRGSDNTPENALTGNFYMVNGPPAYAMQVPQADGRMRFWRNTSVASLGPGQVATLPDGTLGYEWDADTDNGLRPPGTFRLSTTTVNTNQVLQDSCCTYGGTSATHHLTLYRAPSGALVFGAGTIQWSFGLDGTHDNGASTPDIRMQQATVNLFADMGVQPGTLRPGLVTASASTDTTPPSSSISSPAAGTTVDRDTPLTIAGTAVDAGGGVVGGVEVSTDGGTTWHPATSGRESWTYDWTPTTLGTFSLRSRAVDDSGNLGPASAPLSVTVADGVCPCSIWSSSVTPTNISTDTGAVEVGVKLRTDVSGFITGLRFFKGSTNTGTHIGSLWSRTGTLLARATFTSESGSGWQEVAFSTPVAVSADTTYVASYHTDVGHYASSSSFFSTTGVDNAPLHALRSGVDGGNGVYTYGSTPAFPTSTSNATNYWVDVVFTTTPASDTTPPSVVSTTPAADATGVDVGSAVSATFSEDVQPGSFTFTLSGPAGSVAGTTSYDSAARRATFTPSATLDPSSSYTATVADASDAAGNAMTAPTTWSFTTVDPAPATPCSTGCSIWSSSVTPTNISTDTGALEVGVKLRTDVSGYITGIRFFKGSANTGTHIGSLWSRTGTLLARATFTSESSSGWQEVTFSTPVAVSAGTTYVASYHMDAGRYASSNGFFTSSGVDNAPLHALRSGVDGLNGVYKYGSTPAFPTSTFQDSNYWVDIVFVTQL